jgi:hypothetical protein
MLCLPVCQDIRPFFFLLARYNIKLCMSRLLNRTTFSNIWQNIDNCETLNKA